MTRSKLLLFCIGFLMMISQSVWAKATFFIAVPLFIALYLKHPVRTPLAFRLLGFLAILGILLGLLNLESYNLYYFARDILYFIQAPFFLILGLLLYRHIKDYKRFLKVTLLSSFAVTVYNLSQLIFNPSLILNLGLSTRYEVTLMNQSAFLAFVVLFYARKKRLVMISTFFDKAVLSLSLLSVLVSFSRTFYALTILLLVIYYLRNKSRWYKNIFNLSLLTVIFIIFGGLFIGVKGGGLQGDTFKSKVSNSLHEILIVDYNSKAEILNNWRGYEAFLGLSKFYNGKGLELLFGQGFGAVVKTPAWIFDDETLSTIPMFHNGYITILLKTGLLGLLIFILFLSQILKRGSKNLQATTAEDQKLMGFLLLASVFIILLQTFVIHGLFTKTVPVLLLVSIGYAFGYTAEKPKSQVNGG